MSRFDELTNNVPPITLRPYIASAPQEPAYCAYALQFREWSQALLLRALQQSSHISIAQAKVLLLDKRYEWIAAMPKRHRGPEGTRGRHLCIDDVMDEVYQALKAAELSLTPPQMYLPEPEKPPKRERKRKLEPPATIPPPETYGGVILGLRE